MSKTADFTQLISDNEAALSKISAVYTNDPDSRKDLYQEMVLQLWRSFERFRGDAKSSTWLYRVALNTAISFLRKNKKHKGHLSLDREISVLAEGVDEVLEERLEQLYAQIRQLDSLEKGIILLYLEDRSYEEIATITGLSTTNVGTRLSRIKNKLKKQMTQ